MAIPEVCYYQEDEEGVSNGFGVRCQIEVSNVALRDELSRCEGIFVRLCERAEELLSATARKNAVTTFFKFPPEMKTACEQYLIYFVQFLEDLGLRADAEVKESAGRVLFSVIPRDGPAALENVREALEIYLRLPDAPGFAREAGKHPDLAVQQLSANVLH